MLPAAERAFSKALKRYGNPSSPHAEGREAKEALEEARTTIARLAGAKASSVVFTSGATEANALAIVGRVRALNARGTSYADMHILYVPTMHSSARGALEEAAALGVQIEQVPLAGASIDTKVFATRVRDQTVLVCADAVCGETGVRFDTLGIRRVLDASVAKNALLHVDASQLPLIDSIERTHLGADMLVLDAQKVGGVRGIGALILSDRKQVSPLIQGGGQEGGLRSGTEPVALACAFAEALSIRAAQYQEFHARAKKQRAALIAACERDIPSIIITEGKLQAPHILNASLPGLDTDYAVTLLDTEGIAVSTKSACETDSVEGSKAVLAYTADTARAESTLRISWGPETSDRDLRRFPSALHEITTFLTRR